MAKISLTVNGVEGVKVPVTPSDLKYYAKTVILKDTDNVTLTALTKMVKYLAPKQSPSKNNRSQLVLSLPSIRLRLVQITILLENTLVTWRKSVSLSTA
ncbi:immunoglobulin-like domain-containing protein [Listeria grandensis]|uniref:immunoglobulin-like domain-containing protein n=1 Tax=Listeria grandensis TaxID=1494963 RepID=UPI003CC831BA